jgi:hypothetical protein
LRSDNVVLKHIGMIDHPQEEQTNLVLFVRKDLDGEK